jgi:hypothetical protein
MALMMGSLYDALKSADVPDEKAVKAAEEVASYENRLASLETKVDRLTWMVGANITLTVLVLGGLLWR